MQRHLVWLSLSLGVACGGAGPAATTTPEIESLPSSATATAAEPGPSEAEQTGHGGRLFDHWALAIGSDFVPDDASTAAPDGKGGPFGNGTLPDANGDPMPNTGHDYRLKNLLGWDLRGAEGIYGPEFLDQQGVLLPNFMEDSDTREHWLARLRDGGDAFPAYGSVLSTQDLDALLDFLLGVRDGVLPQPADFYVLSPDAPGHYRLEPAGNPARGDALYRNTCATCHGDDGTQILLDDGAHSLGTLARSKAYEVAMKILSGQPGSKMKAQVDGTREAETGDVRDLLAALCNRQRYPKGAASEPDVPDGDPRCGALLK